jgi:NADP-dependent 3-hydroxy acid dehydrogenase YdfG
MQFTGKIALVTGAASGIGKAAAQTGRLCLSMEGCMLSLENAAGLVLKS